MTFRPLTISSVWLCLMILSEYGVFTAVTMTNSSPRGSVVNQQVGQPDCKRYGNDLKCHVPVLDENIDFRNYTGNIEWLTVYCDKKRYLPSRLLDGLFAPLEQTLRYIYIYDCYIYDISRHAFGGLERLQTLWIEGGKNSPLDKNWLKISNVSNSAQQSQTKLALPSTTWYRSNLVLPDGVFSELHNLSSLKLKAMRLNNSVWHAVKHLGNLDNLDLSNNNITIIDINAINKLQKLEELDLSDNYIQVIHNGTFESLSLLWDLSLTSNRIRFIEREAFKGLSRLTTLRLSGNSIRTIDKDTFKGLSKLGSLDLSGNSIRTIDNVEFKELNKLYTLNLSVNSISSVGASTFKGLTGLGTLDLSVNSISTVSTGTFKGLTGLSTLDLSVNNISTVSTGTFKGLTGLCILDLSVNNISTVGASTFKGNTGLRILNLSVNNISSVETYTFNGLGNLQRLYLAENRVRIFSNHTLSHLISLQTLDLSHNLIEKLPKFPRSLFSLDLRNNSIVAVDNSSLAGLPYLTSLDLSGNEMSEFTQYNVPYTVKKLNFSLNEILVGSLNLTNKLTFADLRNNKLESLTINGLKDYRYARESGLIYLAGNGDPFRCSCNMEVLATETTFSYDSSNVGQYHIWNFTSFNCMSVSENMQEAGIIEISARQFVCNTSCYDNCTCYHWRYRGDNINIVDCMGVGLAAVPRNISVSCTILDLSGNMFPLLWSENFDGLSQLVELYLNSSYITEIKEGSFRELSYLQKLDLSNNIIPSLDSGIFIGLSNLSSLDLSFNKIHVVVENTLKYFRRLKNLDLVGNELETISSFDIESMYTITSLRLSKNPWSCDCQFLETFKPFTTENAKHIKDYIDMECYTSNKTVYYVVQINIKKFCPHPDPDYDQKDSKSTAEIAIGSTVGVFVLGNICFLILFRKREFLKLWFFIKCGWKSASVETEDWSRQYDAFVSYSHADEAFVTRELMPRLEEPLQGRLGYNLCVHFRDFPVGGHIPETILEAVNNSRRVIMILSDNFLSSEWCNYEFQAAHHQLLTEWKNRIIMVLLHDLNPDLLDRQLKLYLSTRTYVKLGDPLFWDKIEYAMPERKSPNEENLNTDNNDDQMDNIPAGGDENIDEDVQLID